MKAAVLGLVGCSLLATDVLAKDYTYVEFDLGATQFRDRKDSAIELFDDDSDKFAPLARFIIGGRFANRNPNWWFELSGGTLGKRNIELDQGENGHYERQYYGAGVKWTTNPEALFSLHLRGGVARMYQYWKYNDPNFPQDNDEGVEEDTLYYGGAGINMNIGDSITIGLAGEISDVNDIEDKFDVQYMATTAFYF